MHQKFMMKQFIWWITCSDLKYELNCTVYKTCDELPNIPHKHNAKPALEFHQLWTFNAISNCYQIRNHHLYWWILCKKGILSKTHYFQHCDLADMSATESAHTEWSFCTQRLNSVSVFFE